MKKLIIVIGVLGIVAYAGYYITTKVFTQSTTVNFYNWSDYISEEALPDFEKQTGVKVNYDTFDSNDVLFSKLLAGSSGYDIVVPSGAFLAQQIKSGIFQELDKSKLKNYGNLDASLMELLETYDPNNLHAIPYLWGTTGIGYNVKKIEEILGADAPVDSLDLLFDPKYASKLAACGITILDAPDELMPMALNYMKDDPVTLDIDKLTVKSMQVLDKIRPYLKYIHSSKYIQDLANGEICLALGWSGDILQAKSRAEEAENGVEIVYYIPKEGTGVWFDMLAVPKDAKNVDNAYKLLDYLMNAEVIAGISNYVEYPNANTASLPHVDEEILNNPTIYPTPEVKEKLFTFVPYPVEVNKAMTRAWTNYKTSN